LNLLEQLTLKGPAASRALTVNAAPLPIETSARLIETLLPPFAKKLHAQSSEALGVVAAVQLHVAKQHAVAAQAARRT
jgi:hypothetical protein